MKLAKKTNLLLTEEAVIQKIEYYCSYQERCEQEVIKKLQSFPIAMPLNTELIITHLKAANFLNEERYVIQYIQGKFHIKKWGKQKIVQQLRQKNIPLYLIEKHITLIAEDAYCVKLNSLLEKKRTQLKEPNPKLRQQKLVRYAQQKGYELDFILRTLKSQLE